MARFVGFIVLQSILCTGLYAKAYYPDRPGQGICKDIKDHFDCKRKIESRVLPLLEKFVIRKKNSLIFQKANRKRYSNNESQGEEYCSYWLRGMILGRFLVVEIVYWEGNGYFIFDNVTQKEQALMGLPLLSPLSKRILSFSNSVAYDDVGFQVLKIASDRLTIECKSEDLLPYSANWKNENEIVFLQDETPRRLIFVPSQAKWFLEQPN